MTNPRISSTTLEYQKVVQCSLIFALAFFALAFSVSAQPAMSRGEQLLPISYDECIRRAEQAFASEGWVNIGKGGAFVNAFKENHGAYIMCNVAPENKIWVNIVVASLSQNDNVPGAERVKLQERMGQSGSGNSSRNQLAGTWEGTSGDGRFREVWNITENSGRWSVSGAFYDKQTGQQTGGFYVENVRFQSGVLSFRMIFAPKPHSSWADSVEFSSVTVSGDNLTSRHAYGTGTLMRRR